jgi:hypothetical protein
MKLFTKEYKRGGRGGKPMICGSDRSPASNDLIQKCRFLRAVVDVAHEWQRKKKPDSGGGERISKLTDSMI